jgi:ribose-phosphate pyrophosphokinase
MSNTPSSKENHPAHGDTDTWIKELKSELSNLRQRLELLEQPRFQVEKVGPRFKFLVFSTNSGKQFADRLVSAYPRSYQRGSFNWEYFPNGDPHPHFALDPEGKYITRPASRNCVVIASIRNAVDLEELGMLVETLAQRRVSSTTILMTNFGSATMDREPDYVSGQVVTSKYRAQLVSRWDQAKNGNSLLIIQPHTPQLMYYFDQNLNPKCIPVAKEFSKMVKTYEAEVVSTTDIGGSKTVGQVRDFAGNELAVVDSVRNNVNPNKKEILGVLGKVVGKRVLVIDDLTRTMSSLVNAARALKEQGAIHVDVAVVHFEGSLEALENALALTFDRAGQLEYLFSNFICFDTTPEAEMLEGIPQLAGRVVVHQCQSLVHEHLNRIAADISWPRPMEREMLMSEFDLCD